MSGKDDNDRPPPGEDRTVFSPLPGALQGGSSPPGPTPPGGDNASAKDSESETAAPGDAAPETPAEGSAPPGGGSAPAFIGSQSPASGAAAASEARAIQIGDVLNHIFEVRRFIARGGMGEVFEGINVNTDERVAIKVILPHLAADEAVQAMFRKEARTLTRLSHPGLVQYRVLAQEPQLGALYIVTEYIDGVNLNDQFGSLQATPQQLVGLLKKLAEGLGAAHALGAIHRDISPDNVMLEGGRLENAKIIDFGIAKDLDAAGQTIIGDGFAGKLNYVAPEQLGDFNREVGPWTDVYSLALTIMAVAFGRDVNMGATLVEAVDKRRAGIDLSDAPVELQPVLEAMLRPNPAERLRSMDEVLAMLENTGLTPATGFQPLPPGLGGGQDGAMGSVADAIGMSKKAMAVTGLGLVLAVIVAGALLFTPGKSGEGSGDKGAEEVVIGPPPEDPVAAARQAVEAELPSIPCSWLDLVDVQAEGTSAQLSLRGVSGKSAAALDLLERSLKRAGLTASSMDFSDVSPIPVNFCRAVEAFNSVRAPGPGRLSVKQRKFEMGILPPSAGPDAGKLGSQAVFTLDLKGLKDEMALVGLEEAGTMQQMAPNKAIVTQYSESLGNDSYRFTLNTTHSGWSGILMLTGKGPFDGELLTHAGGPLGSAWTEKFEKLAKERNWQSEMVWYRTVDEVAN